MDIQAYFDQLDHRLLQTERKLEFWWRDDDLDSTGIGLDGLKRAVDSIGLSPLLAAIPQRMVAERLRYLAIPSEWVICQHGYSHVSHEGESGARSEFGEARSSDSVRQDLLRGRERLQGLFGAQYLDVMVPPWSKFAARHEPIISDLGYQGFSCSGLSPRSGIAANTIQENVHIDLLQWGGAPGGPVAASWTKIQEVLERCLTGSSDRKVVRLGILTHHKAMKEDAFALLLNFVAMTAEMQSTSWLPAAQLFE